MSETEARFLASDMYDFSNYVNEMLNQHSQLRQKKEQPMRVQSKQFPNCCNAAVIYGLGGTPTTLYGVVAFGREELKKEVERHIKNYTDSGYSMLCCTINNDQTDAQDVLEKLGFQGTGWMKKKVHPETCLQMYWKPLFGGIIPNSEEHQEWIEEQEEPTDLELEEIEQEEAEVDW